VKVEPNQVGGGVTDIVRDTADWLQNYTVSQKKTSPTFLAITRESIDGFL